jgi:hypothetical protein
MFETSKKSFQGSWFYQVGFILYPPWGMSEWNVSDHRQVSLSVISISS